jgi:hypothetical protein
LRALRKISPLSWQRSQVGRQWDLLVGETTKAFAPQRIQIAMQQQM